MKKLVLLPIITCICLLGNSLLASTDTLSEPERIALQAKSDSLFAAGVDLYKAKKYQDAISLFTEADRIDKAILDSTSNRRDYSAMWLASCFYHLGDSAQAAKISPDYYRFSPVDRRLTIESDSLSTIGLSYFNQMNYEIALNYHLQSAEILSQVVGENHILYGNLIDQISTNYYALSDTINTIKLYQQYANIVMKNYGVYSEKYLNRLSVFAAVYYNLGDNRNAILQYERAFFIADYLGLETQKQSCARKINEIGLSLNGKDAREYYRKSLIYLERCLEDSFVIESRRAVEINIAVSYTKEADENYKDTKYMEAISLETEALKIYERIYGKEHSDYATSLNNIATCNWLSGNYTEAISLETEALKIYERIYGKEHPDYATSLSNLANYNSSIGNYTEAVRLGTEALKIRERVLGKEHPDYATLVGNLAGYNSELGDYAKAASFGAEASDIYEHVLGKEHPYRILAKENLGRYCFYAKDLAVDGYVREATEGNMAFIRKMFGGMTGYERSNFWGTKEGWFNHWLPNFAYGMGTDTLVECAVNGALMSKGLLLNSEIEMTRLLQESGDEEALEKYQELRLNRLQLNKLYEKPIAERPLDADSLEAVVDRLERELVAMSKAYGDYTRNLVIDWRQVQAKLGERDAAVEFVRFAVMESDSVMYAAYVTRPGYAVPRMIPLFEARQLEALADFEYEDERLSELVWKPLAEVLSGVERVYFAPAGELYNMAIESAPDWEEPERLMSDRWELYRLSSTRELAVTYDDNTAASASVYGGIDYDRVERGKSKDEKGREAQLSIEEASAGGKKAWLADSLGLRAGVESLPGTRVEAEAVDRSLRGRRVASELLTDSLGSEWSIKALSGLRKGLLHIATHGFYYSEEEIQEMGSRSFLRLDGMQGARYVEDKALTRSGLLMAGANNALKGEAAEGENDGILTAKEISQLDLRGMDLVVLSACQTGLGEVTGDGVFGLQRGFKKAGARSLLMSLWKVDDKATQLLMERFYDNLTAGMSKHEALLDAQRYVREYEVSIDTKSDSDVVLPGNLMMHPYSNPKYWAGFVLLDGQ